MIKSFPAFLTALAIALYTLLLPACKQPEVAKPEGFSIPGIPETSANSNIVTGKFRPNKTTRKAFKMKEKADFVATYSPYGESKLDTNTGSNTSGSIHLEVSMIHLSECGETSSTPPGWQGWQPAFPGYACLRKLNHRATIHHPSGVFTAATTPHPNLSHPHSSKRVSSSQPFVRFV